ncbi:WGR and DUF4132 domain-containing protein [Undibacterium sp. TJN19]|uniref:WGR and DUF4132 domain-containing protein n=1 Tax=Undibacterium sp. TJN19 TaxID=3413055 RepID=UPI003BF12267
MRRFEFTDDKSAKFWEIEQADTDLNIRWGRIGTAGQSQTKNFADAGKATTAMQKLVTEKTGKGYLETITAAGASIGATAAKETEARPAAKKTAKEETTTSTATAEPATQAEAKSTIVATPAESLDQQIERGFEEIRVQVAAATLVLPEGGLTVAKIRRLHNVNEAAANQIHKQLLSLGMIHHWSSALTNNAQAIATELGQASVVSQHAGGQAQQASDGNTPPWLANGEPLRLGSGTGLDIRSLSFATRRFPKPVNQVDPQRAWLQLRQEILAAKDPDFAGTDVSLREDFDTAWQSLGNPKLTGTLKTDAILLVLCLNQQGYNTSEFGVQFVNYLVARHGLPYTVDVLLEALKIEVIEEYVRKGKNKNRLSHTVTRPLMHTYYGAMTEGEACLRKHLAVAPQEIYDICLEKIRTALPQIAAERQPALAMLLPDTPEVTHEVIYRLCAAGVKTPDTVHWLQLTAIEPAALAMARKVKTEGYSNFWGRTEMVNTVLLEQGIKATLWLTPGADQEQAGEALTRIGTPEALEALARVASTSKTALARFMLAVDRWPAAAMAALAKLLSGNSKDNSLLLPTLIQLLRTQPTLASDLQPWLEPAGIALIAKLQARLAGPTDIATNEELPEVLANIPWLQAKKKATQSLQLPPLPLAAVENWDAAKKTALLDIHPWYRGRYESAAKTPDIMAEELGFTSRDVLSPERKQVREAIKTNNLQSLLEIWRMMLARKKGERYYYFVLDARSVAQMQPELGIPFWNAIAGEVSCRNVDYLAAHWGLPALPGVMAKINTAPTENLSIALNLGVTELAPIAARAFAKLKSLRGVGRQWLKRFPEHAACGLIATALGKPSEARDCAASALRWLASNGHATLLDEVASRYGQPEVITALHAMLGESALQRYPNKRPALPDFWQPSGWNRPVLHNGRALPDGALDAIGTMMMFPTNEEIYAGLPQIKAACTPQSLADFAWDNFSAWINAGAPSKDGWSLTSLGLLGTDETARLLTPYIRAWPGEAAHARAVTGLDVLANIGTDVALMLLNGIAQKVKFKGLQDKAREKISAIAEARGLTPEELEDRLAPDLGLDEQGSMVLDFGPRAYKVGFDESLKPYVREWLDGKAGARLPDLPKPKKTDDETLAKEATERFKLLKKDARTIASQQVLRLEVAMCVRRRWSADVFARFIATHPLVRHLVRRLVWGVYVMPEETSGEGEDQETTIASYGGVLQSCFRVSEDGDYTTAQDDPFELPAGAQYKIGLPHALELPAREAAEFGQLLADYELLQPFAQLGRDTYTLTAEEKATTKLLRWKDLKVPTGKVLGLVNIGWRRGPAQDGGCIWTFDKPVDTCHALELMLEPGVIVGMVDEYPEQTLGEITLGSVSRWGSNDHLKDFSALDAIVASELIRDMERLRS